MTPRNGYPDGAPCWADLTTPDLAGAQRFYGAVIADPHGAVFSIISRLAASA